MIYDVIIIGAGPAGMTAAIYALRANKKVLILEKERIGGQISSSPLVENYPGFKAISGNKFADELYEQVMSLGGDLEIEEVLKIEQGKIKTVITDMGKHQTKTIIIATGAKYRKLGLDREEELIGNGISFCVTCDGPIYKDKIVAVIGGGNTAVVNAIALSDICRKVYVVQNLSTLTAEASLTDKLTKKGNVEIIYNAIVTKLQGINELTAINIIINNREMKEVKLDGMFISIGLEPQNEFVKKQINQNRYGYIQSNANCETSQEGIYVAGDCRDKKVKQITTAVSDGTIAALNAIAYLNI